MYFVMHNITSEHSFETVFQTLFFILGQ